MVYIYIAVVVIVCFTVGYIMGHGIKINAEKEGMICIAKDPDSDDEHVFMMINKPINHLKTKKFALFSIKIIDRE